jgi:hypothetical protein
MWNTSMLKNSSIHTDFSYLIIMQYVYFSEESRYLVVLFALGMAWMESLIEIEERQSVREW